MMCPMEDQLTSNPKLKSSRLTTAALRHFLRRSEYWNPTAETVTVGLVLRQTLFSLLVCCL